MEHHHEETRECLSHGAGTIRDTAKVLGDSKAALGGFTGVKQEGWISVLTKSCAVEWIVKTVIKQPSPRAESPPHAW